jgi:hypothetical protein
LQGPEQELPRAVKERIVEFKRLDSIQFPSPGSCFLRTDQLDGETDWKLRLPVACTQRLPTAAVSGFSCRSVHWQEQVTAVLSNSDALGDQMRDVKCEVGLEGDGRESEHLPVPICRAMPRADLVCRERVLERETENRETLVSCMAELEQGGRSSTWCPSAHTSKGFSSSWVAPSAHTSSGSDLTVLPLLSPLACWSPVHPPQILLPA